MQVRWPLGARIIVAVACAGCASAESQSVSDLAITHAAVLDVATGSVLHGRTVFVTNGIITSVTADPAATHASRVIDAHGRLLTPGFIDAHLHLCSMYAPACTDPYGKATQLVMTPDSIASYRRHLASLYLPYGVTAVRDVGSDEHAMPMLLAWMKRSPDAPDFHPSGAQLISPDPNHKPAPWQVEVADSAAAAAKARAYHDLGIRNIKLYWRLREPAFEGALRAAQDLGMNVTGHVDFNVVPVDRALDLGLRNFEHMTAWAFTVLTQADIDRLYRDVGRRIGTGNSQYPGFFYLAVPEEWNQVGKNNPKLLALVDQFKAADASVTPTLHVFAQRLGLTWFTSPPRDPSEVTTHWTARDHARAVEGYRVMASYVKRLHDAGVRLNVGTDAPEPGKSVLSEMLLLHDAGISMPDVFRIATFESARGIGHSAEYGSIEAGKRADMILFDGDPLREPRDLLGGKTTIKDGVVYRAADTYGASGATLVTDSAEYTVRFVKPFYRARIGFAYTNHTGDAVSANMCHGPTPPTLEKEVSPGRWVVAYNPFLQLCRSEPPFRVVAGATYRGVLDLLVAPKGSSIGPALRVDSIAGTYRLRWALRAGSDPDNRSAPLIESISPSFFLVAR